MHNINEVNPLYKMNSLLANLIISNDLMERIKVAQETNEQLQGFLTSLSSIKKGEDDVIRFEGRLFIPKNKDLRNEGLHEAHHFRYTTHPDVTQMYQYMKMIY